MFDDNLVEPFAVLVAEIERSIKTIIQGKFLDQMLVWLARLSPVQDEEVVLTWLLCRLFDPLLGNKVELGDLLTNQLKLKALLE